MVIAFFLVGLDIFFFSPFGRKVFSDDVTPANENLWFLSVSGEREKRNIASQSHLSRLMMRGESEVSISSMGNILSPSFASMSTLSKTNAREVYTQCNACNSSVLSHEHEVKKVTKNHSQFFWERSPAHLWENGKEKKLLL